MLQEGKIRSIQSPYTSLDVLTRKNNGLPPDSPEAYRFTIDYRKLNAITKYPLPVSITALRALALNSREQLIREQMEDPKIGHIYRYLENPDDGSVNATVFEGWSHDLKLIDGLLF
ncbi:hypothetical protein TNCV_4603591 [Trichonephila clavipes]|nr:hypothetical protein TNCV_4603591 [Trichonephila clavipes]